MECVYCSAQTKIYNSRPSKKGLAVWRRHRCFKCSAVFTTYETVSLDTTHRVENHNGTLSPFSRSRLLISIYKALDHRTSASEEAEEITTTAVLKITRLKKPILPRQQIIDTVVQTLRNFDPAAAIKYQTLHEQKINKSEIKRVLKN